VSFWANYALALALVAIMLAGLAFAGRFLKRTASRAHAGGRFVCVVESAMLSPHASLHVVKAGRGYLLIGVTNASICRLAEIDASDSFDSG
jgi:flagellar biogenesis protein FliO